MIKRSVMAIAAIVSLVSLTTAFAAGDAAKQIATAEVHAQMAASVKDINMVHAHLHHVINCLVGPKGKLFDSTAEDPCKGMGDGALADLGDAPKVRAKLEMAVKHAERGIKSTSYKMAHAAAVRTEELVKQAGAIK